MNTLEINPEIDLAEEIAGKIAKSEKTAEASFSAYKKLMASIDAKENKRVGWFMASILAQGVLLLPVPAALMYYYNAPVWVLAVTTILFFANLVAGMGGLKLKVLVALMAGGFAINLAMILAFVL